MRDRPLQIYLDSSDYSVFGDVLRSRGTPENAAIFQKLIEYSSYGVVEFPFSSLHVSEAAAKNNSSVEAAAHRLRAIDMLARGKSLRSWTELSSLDILSKLVDLENVHLKPVNRKRFHGRSPSGEWLPGLPLKFTEIADTIRSMHNDPVGYAVSQELVTSHNRQQRRAMKRHRGEKNLHRQRLLESIDAQWSSVYANLARAWSLPLADSETWRRFTRSSNPDARGVYESFRRAASNLSNFSLGLSPGEGTMNDHLTSWLARSSEKLLVTVRHFHTLREQVIGDPELFTKQFLARQMRELLQNFNTSWRKLELQELEESYADLTRSLVISREIGDLVPPLSSAEAVFDLAAIRARGLVFKAYISKTFSAAENIRDEQKYRSDVGDLMHAQYLPYCDVFRCDGFASTYLSGPARAVDTLLIKSRTNLVDLIDERVRSAG